MSARNRMKWSNGDPAKTLRLAEGLLARLRDAPAESRPDQTTAGYLARHYGVSIQKMKLRIADAEARRNRDDLADNWLECIYQIGNELGERLLAKTFAIAHDTSNRNSFNAQKFLLNKLDPDVYSDSAETRTTTQAETRSLISDIEQEVFDEANEVEEAQLVEIEQTIAEAMIKLEQWTRRIRKRIADKRVQEIERGD